MAQDQKDFEKIRDGREDVDRSQDETVRDLEKIRDEDVDRSQDQKIREESHDERDISSSNGVDGSYGR